jgi:transposase
MKAEHRLVERARIVWIRLVRGLSVSATARKLGISRPTVRLWTTRYAEERGLWALRDASRSGRPPRIGTREQAVVLSLACRRPEELGRPEARMFQATIVEEAGRRGVRMSRSSVQRILAGAEVQPHRERYYLFTKKDRPDYARLRDAICEAYLQELPDDEVLVCMDEKTGIQALGLPPGLPNGGRRAATYGIPARIDQHYVRHGSRTLVVAVKPGTGELVLGRTYPARGYKTDETIEFLREVAQSLPGVRRIHLVWDNGTTHVSKQMKTFLASDEGQRFSALYTPAHASWLNLAENFFSRFTRRYLTGRRYESLQALDDHLEAAMDDYPRVARPMRWTYNPAQRKAA